MNPLAAFQVITIGRFWVIPEVTAFCLLLRMPLVWAVRYSEKLNHVRGHVQRKSQDLAHDFQNRILALRSLMNRISGKLDLDELQRLNNAINDLSGYTEQLSLRLVPEAFELLSVPGAIPVSSTTFSTYLRGALEIVAQEQSAILQNTIPIRFDDIPLDSEPFVMIGRSALARIISNLLSNSIESCRQNGTKDVRVSVSQSQDGYVCVQVIDNGTGIEVTNQHRVFTQRFTTKGPERGKGLTSSADLAQQAQAKLRLVKSEVGVGTVVELQVLRSTTPRWFINRIRLTNRSVLVIVDDEGEIFDFWTKTISERLSSLSVPGPYYPALLRISSPSDLRNNVDGCLDRGTLFLVDYKLTNDETVNGISLIEELHLEEKSLLVTNFFEREDVVAAVDRLNLHLMPKAYMLNVKYPIDIGGDE